MQVEILRALPRRRSLSIAFLHEARDPAAQAPRAVREELREACRATGFRGREKEVAGSASGGWALIGLGKAPAAIPVLRRALRRAARDAAKRARGDLLLVFDAGTAERELRAAVREAAQLDYRFDRYKSRPRDTGAEMVRVSILPPDGAESCIIEDEEKNA